MTSRLKQRGWTTSRLQTRRPSFSAITRAGVALQSALPTSERNVFFTELVDLPLQHGHSRACRDDSGQLLFHAKNGDSQHTNNRLCARARRSFDHPMQTCHPRCVASRCGASRCGVSLRCLCPSSKGLSHMHLLCLPFYRSPHPIPSHPQTSPPPLLSHCQGTSSLIDQVPRNRAWQ